MSQAKSSKLPAFIVIALCAGSLATGAFVINQSPVDENTETAGAVYILGPARSMLAKGLYARADLYFHKGAPPIKNEAFHGFFQQWKEAICPTKHAHTEGSEVEEILPWLRLATKSDPHNIEVYLVASYWLNSDCNRTDLAVLAIQEALEKNPDRYELQQELGRLHLSLDELNAASAALEQALLLLTTIDQSDPEQAAIDLSFILSTRSFLYEALGDKERTLKAARESLAFKPTQNMQDRLDMLELGAIDPEAAKEQLDILFKKSHSCDREDEHDHDHDEHGEHVHGPDCNHEAEEEHVHGPECNH